MGVIKKKEKREKRKEELDIRQQAIEVKDGFKIQDLNFKIEVIDKSNSITFGESRDGTLIDTSKVKFPLFVRKWKKGDYFYPLGMKGKMKLSNFYINQKISILEKEKIWLLCDVQDQIIWVIGKRLDDRFKITDTTTEILKITTKYE